VGAQAGGSGSTLDAPVKREALDVIGTSGSSAVDTGSSINQTVKEEHATTNLCLLHNWPRTPTTWSAAAAIDLVTPDPPRTYKIHPEVRVKVEPLKIEPQPAGDTLPPSTPHQSLKNVPIIDLDSSPVVKEELLSPSSFTGSDIHNSPLLHWVNAAHILAKFRPHQTDSE
jgi:hypothetical protein